jgi:hypothetical protein
VDLSNLLVQTKGKTKLFFSVTDESRDVSLHLFSKNMGIEVTQKLIDSLISVMRNGKIYVNGVEVKQKQEDSQNEEVKEEDMSSMINEN